MGTAPGGGGRDRGRGRQQSSAACSTPMTGPASPGPRLFRPSAATPGRPSPPIPTARAEPRRSPRSTTGSASATRVGRRSDPTWVRGHHRCPRRRLPHPQRRRRNRLLRAGRRTGGGHRALRSDDRPTAHGSAPVVRAVAEALPVADRTFDAVLAVLTTHHWSDRRAGVGRAVPGGSRPGRAHLRSGRARASSGSSHDYVPEIASLGTRWAVPRGDGRVSWGPRSMVLPLGRDFEDGVLGAFWCRPHAYLDPGRCRRHIPGSPARPLGGRPGHGPSRR